MHTPTLTLVAALAFTVSACGGTDMPDNGLPTSGANSDASPSPSAISSPSSPRSPTKAPVAEPPDAAEAVESTLADAEEFAVELEQVFFDSGYPKDLAGAIAAADKTDLQLEPGNTIASYVFEPDTSEFRLCVENVSGAYATYDTRPMSMRESGPSGGCP